MFLLLCFAEYERKNILGIYVFRVFKDIIKWSEGFLSYNDYVRPSMKKSNFLIIKYNNNEDS